MSRREMRRQAGRQRSIPEASSEASSNATDLHTPRGEGEMRGEQLDIYDYEGTGPVRESRSRKRDQGKVKEENMYLKVLAASGIETEDMDEEEKQQLAKILLLSKTEAEMSSGAALVSEDERRTPSPERLHAGERRPPGHEQNPPAHEESPSDRERSAPAREESPSGMSGRERSVQTARDRSARDGKQQTCTHPYKAPISPASDGSVASCESIIILEEEGPATLSEEADVTGHRRGKSAQTRTLASHQPDTDEGQDLPQVNHVRRQEEIQCYPQNSSISQIFSDDEEDSGPQSQDLFPHIQTRSQDQMPEQQEMDDEMTQAEDVVDGQSPAQTLSDLQTVYDEETQPMEYEETGCRKSFHPHTTAQIDHTDIGLQEKNVSCPQSSFFARKRKAEFEASSMQKQSRLEEDQESDDREDEEDGENKGTSTARWTGMDRLTGALVMRPLNRRYRRSRRISKDKKLYAPSGKECNGYTSLILHLFDVYRMELREAQSHVLNHVQWGESVKPGRHMSRTIDAKRRGRPSVYLDDLDDLDEGEEEGEVSTGTNNEVTPQITARITGEITGEITNERRSGKRTTISSIQEIDSDDGDDFDFAKNRTFTLSKKPSKPKTPTVSSAAFGETSESDWFNSCSGAMDSGRSDLQNSRVKPLRKSVRKPQLVFAKRINTPDVEKCDNVDHTGEVVKPVMPVRFYPNRALRKENQKTYGKKRTLRSDSPIFLDNDEDNVMTKDNIQTSNSPTTDAASKTVDSDVETQDPGLEPADPGLAPGDPDLETLDPGRSSPTPLTSSPPSSPLFQRTRSVNSAKKSVSKTWTFLSSPSGNVKVSMQEEEICLLIDDEPGEKLSKRNDEHISGRKKSTPDLASSKIAGKRSLSRVSSKDLIEEVHDSEVLDEDKTSADRNLSSKQQNSLRGKGNCRSDTANPSTSGVNVPKILQACSLDECPDTLKDLGDEEEEYGHKELRGKALGGGSGSKTIVKQSSPLSRNLTCDRHPADVGDELSTRNVPRRLGVRGKRLKSHEVDETDTRSGSGCPSRDHSSSTGEWSYPTERKSTAGYGGKQRSEIYPDQNSETHNKACVARGPKTPNRKQSILFSDNDESFNLGVQSPSRAFPGAFTSFSDENSPVAGSNSSPAASAIRADEVPPEDDPLEAGRRPEQSPFSTKVMARKPLRAASTGNNPRKLREKESPAEMTNQAAPKDLLEGRRGKRKRGADLDIHDNSRRMRRASPELADEESRLTIDLEEETPQPDRAVEVGEVACPLCGVMFTQKKIEAHASSCNGPSPDAHGGEHGARGANPDEWGFAVHNREDDNREEETCYICDAVFSKGDEYRQHVDQCLSQARRQQAQLEQGSKVRHGRAGRTMRSRPDQGPTHNYTEVTDDEGDQFEAPPPGQKKRKVEASLASLAKVAPSTGDNDWPSESSSDKDMSDSVTPSPEGDGGQSWSLAQSTTGSASQSTEIDLDGVSNSPIKSFRRIGQLDGCLIDFNNQFKKKSESSKRRTTTKKKTTRRSRKRKKRAAAPRKTGLKGK